MAGSGCVEIHRGTSAGEALQRDWVSVAKDGAFSAGGFHQRPEQHQACDRMSRKQKGRLGEVNIGKSENGAVARVALA